MAQYKNSGLDSKSLAEKKSKRLEEALSAYTPEQTKQTVSKLLEDYVDESGKNYFGAGNRDTTLYFADDDYIREIEKEKAKDSEKEHHPKEEKVSVVDKLHKLTSILPKAEHHNNIEEPLDKKAVTEEIPTESVSEDGAYEEEIKSAKTEDIVENIKEKTVQEKTYEDTEPQEKVSAQENQKAEEVKKAEMPEPEPTIVITPVKAEASEKEDTEEMRREFFDDEVEVEAVPRRRRKQAEPPAEDKKAPEINIDDVDDDDYEDNFEEEEKKSKFGNFFKRKKSDPFEDDDEFDDDEFDDDDDYYDDEYDDYDEGGSVFKKVLNAIVIIALVCSTAFFAASNYSNIKKLESANTQINELNNGASGSSDEEVNELKAKVDALTAENERLKNGGTANTGEPTSTSSSGTSSTTITGTAPAGESSSTGSASGSTYTVKSGDNGSKICTAVYGQYTEELWQKILDANGMTTSSVYHPGDVLQIP